jgi:hypothetical protein
MRAESIQRGWALNDVEPLNATVPERYCLEESRIINGRGKEAALDDGIEIRSSSPNCAWSIRREKASPRAVDGQISVHENR